MHDVPSAPMSHSYKAGPGPGADLTAVGSLRILASIGMIASLITATALAAFIPNCAAVGIITLMFGLHY
jgi:hypothetical protein